VAEAVATTTTEDPGSGASIPDPQVRRFSDLFEPAVSRHPRLVEAALYLLALALGWNFRFVEDDAFITYRYAQNFAKGRGLVFNPGQKVEGYTNFLWTLIHALPEKAGWSTPMFSQLLGLAIFVATVAVALRLARAITGSETAAVFAVLVLLANMTFVGYGTSGLETMFQTLLATSIGLLLLPDTSHRLGLASRRIAAGVLGGIALMVRLDTAVLIAAWFLVSLVVEWRRGAPEGRPQRAITGAALLGVPALVVVTPWLVWKVGYYGSLLPNTFAAKTGTSTIQPILFGIAYVLGFFAWYGAFLLIGRWRRHRRSLFELPGLPQIAVVVGVWCLYVVLVGADFMEFRFMVPIIPLLAIVAAHLIDRYVSLKREIVLMVVLALFSFAHTQTGDFTPPVLAFHNLSHWPGDYATSWRSMGDQLRDAFPGGVEAPGQPVVAIDPLGVIPYYSQLPTVDMLGLTDKEIARHGLVGPYYYPGHVRLAPISYLERRKVNLLVGLPLVVDLDPTSNHDHDPNAYRTGELIPLYPVVDLRQLPSTAKVIEIPLDDTHVWAVIYLTPNDKVDAAIAAHHWRTLPIVDRCKPADSAWQIKLVGTKTCPT
jgi:arabinofuranosyltransferase